MAQPPRSRRPPHRSALAAAGCYLAFGILWILLSDRLIASLSDDIVVLSRLQSAKGSLFVVLSALAMYFVLRLHADASGAPGELADRGNADRPRLRLQLFLLTAATTLPLIALLAFNVQRESRRDVEMAGESAQNLARLFATDAARIVRDTRLIAERLAKRPDLRMLEADRCDAQLVEVTRLLPYIANAVTVRRDGVLVCSALPPPGPPPRFTGSPVLERVVQSGRPTVGRLARGPLSNRWVVPVAAALRDGEDRITGSLVMTIDVARLAPLGQPPAGAGSVMSLIDGAGSVLFRVPEAGRVGANASESEIVRIALDRGDGRGRARGYKGDDQVFGFARVDGSDWVAIAAMPANAALAASRESAARSSILGALILLVSGILAYAAGRRVERPMRAIAAAARSVAEGDLAARAPVAGSRETAEVAAQLNRLLDRLPRIESELRQSQRRLSLVLDAAREGVLVADPAQAITFANDAGARLLGFDATSDLMGRRLPEVLADSTREGSRGEARIDRTERYEVRLRGHDGVARWLFVSTTLLRSDTGSVEGTLAMLYDVTERKEVEERLARVTRLYWALSSVNEAIVRTTERTTLFAETCRVVVADGGFVTTFISMLDARGALLTPVASAGPTYDIIGKTPISLAKGAAYAEGPLATAVRTGQPDVVNDFFADDRTRPARAIAEQMGIRSSATFPLRSEGRVVGALVVYAAEVDYFDIGLSALLHQVADDVSFALDVYARAAARDRAEAAVRELNADLERRVDERTARLTEANQELEAFSYSVSHDLRAPVRAISGFAQLLSARAHDALDDEGRRLLGNVARASAHMGRLIDDLLRFAQMGRSAVELRPVALAPVIERVVEAMRPSIEACGAQIRVAQLPDVVGEPTLLHQIFSNLLENAIEYRRRDVPPRVEVAWQERGERIEIAVRDNGIGIDPEHQTEIFEMFIRLHPASAHPGTGIGLAIVAKAVALMHGEVTVESIPGEGATFRVVLRRA